MLTAAFSAFVLSIALQSSLAAWKAPAKEPPEENAPPPLNSSKNTNYKDGALIIARDSALFGGNDKGFAVENGFVGIGTLEPAEKLEVSGNILVHGAIFSKNFKMTAGAADGYVLTSDNQGSASWKKAGNYGTVNDGLAGQTAWYSAAGNTISGTNNLYISPSSGNVGVGKTSPGAKLDVNGTVRAGSFIYSSDKALKYDIAPLADAETEKLLDMQAVSFKWKNSGEKAIGLIAQDVEKLFPELVKTSRTDNLKSIDYAGLIPVIIERLKRQQEEIESLRGQTSNISGQTKNEN